MDLVYDLLVNRISSDRKNPCMKVDTILFVAEAIKFVGQNYDTTKIDTESSAELIGRLIFKPSKRELNKTKTYMEINKIFSFIMENLEEVKLRVYKDAAKFPTKGLESNS
jgi:hypothetical protein